ncbi:sigma 54-interacting transcriptional regulator [Hellea balneolensis]|uniref:sigma 54-interacting transcriptional regulator n=1 Tax=Hellea balneolensis TaxID=287478 RepID=UPI00042627BA|nr:sigma 54-interacting transcriptional regulator [Hellea balneolensis]
MSAIPAQPIGQSDSFHALLDRVSDAASLGRPVIVVGERGTGKEMIASRLHFLSPRWEAQFVKVNCAAFSDEMLDRELFGQTFMDGQDDTNGRFYEANGGTIFLDNIETLSPRLQEKLMRAVEYGEYEAGGEAYTQQVDVRIVTATGIDLPAAVARGEFRVDLVDRLAFDVITIPPLRYRPEDVAPLAEHFGRKISGSLGADSFPGFTPEIMVELETRPWTGNVRELKAVIERNVAQAFLRDESLSAPIAELSFDPFEGPYRLRDSRPPPQIEMPEKRPIYKGSSELSGSSTLLPATKGQPVTPELEVKQSFVDRIMVFERRLIDEAMKLSDGHQGKAAKHLDLTYHSFRGLLRKHGLKK